MHTLTQVVLAREKRISALAIREKLLSGFYTALVEFYTEEVLWGFLPCGFLEENICVLVLLCFCACCSFSDLLVTNCFKISSKKFKKNQHGIRATLKGSTTHLGFFVMKK